MALVVERVQALNAGIHYENSLIEVWLLVLDIGRNKRTLVLLIWK